MIGKLNAKSEEEMTQSLPRVKLIDTCNMIPWVDERPSGLERGFQVCERIQRVGE